MARRISARAAFSIRPEDSGALWDRAGSMPFQRIAAAEILLASPNSVGRLKARVGRIGISEDIQLEDSNAFLNRQRAESPRR